MDLVKVLEHYVPYNEQEEKDRQVMLQLLRTTPDIFERKNQTAHFTASSWLLNREHDKVLMIYHNIYHSWAWTGGHADGERNLLSVAVREVCEESGLTPAHVRPAWLISQKGDLSQGSAGDIFSLEVLAVDGHFKKGEYISAMLDMGYDQATAKEIFDTLWNGSSRRHKAVQQQALDLYG